MSKEESKSTKVELVKKPDEVDEKKMFKDLSDIMSDEDVLSEFKNALAKDIEEQFGEKAAKEFIDSLAEVSGKSQS